MAYIYPFKDADEQLKLIIWKKGKPIPGFEENVWRWDKCGHIMKYFDHGNTESEYGWEIDHIYPSEGDNISNLQPLNWQNNRDKGESVDWNCPQQIQ